MESQTALVREISGAAGEIGASYALLVIAPTPRELGGLKASRVCRAATVGIGHPSCEALTSLISQHHPALILSLGFAGALKSGLRSGTLTLHTTALQENAQTPLAYDARAVGVLRETLRTAGLSFQEGPLLTVSRALLSPAAKHAHGSASDALAVDMEGYWLAQAAAEAGVPMVAIRAVLDEVDHRLPDIVDAIIAGGGRNEWRYSLQSLRTPRTAAALVPLAVRSWRANHALQRAAGVLLPALLATSGRLEP